MTAKNNKKKWTQEQEDFLLECYGSSNIQVMMDRLGRTEAAIKQKYKELMGFYNVKEALGTFSAREIAEALGVNHKTVLIWIETRGFPAKQILKKRNDTKRREYIIDPYSMWKWVGNNRDRINFAHIKLGYILPEPDWLAGEIKKAYTHLLKRPKNWTTEEDETAWFWYRTGIHYKEIAKRLNRPEKGTWARLNRITKKKIEENKIKW